MVKYVDVTACVFGVQSWCFNSSLTPSDWAAWIQAIGSVLAVGSAIGLVAWQLRHERSRAVDAEVNHLQLLWTFAYHCRVEMQYLAETCKIGNPWPVEPAGLRTKIAALRAVSVLDLPDAHAAIAALTAVEAYETYQRNTEAIARGSSPRAYLFEPHANACLSNFEFAEGRLRRALEDRGASHPEGMYSINEKSYPPLEAK